MLMGGLEVGIGHPTRIVAELGTLHHHQGIDGLMLATRDAFNAGADFVKVQLIDPKTAWWASDYQLRRYHSLYKSFKRSYWPIYLARANKELGPTFASVFDQDTLSEVYREMPAVKIAYIARIKDALVEACVDTGKPVIISLGDDKLSQRVLQMSALSKSTVKRLFCQSVYPLPDFRARLPLFGSIYHGLSAHTDNTALLCASFILGAELLEVHVQSTDASGADTKYALDIDRLKRLIEIRDMLSSFSLYTCD